MAARRLKNWIVSFEDLRGRRFHTYAPAATKRQAQLYVEQNPPPVVGLRRVLLVEEAPASEGSVPRAGSKARKPARKKPATSKRPPKPPPSTPPPAERPLTAEEEFDRRYLRDSSRNNGDRRRLDTLYRAVRARSIPFDHHESDLYVPDTPATRGLARVYGHRFTTFLHAVNGERWLDVPFAYDPWFQRAGGEAAKSKAEVSSRLAKPRNARWKSPLASRNGAKRGGSL